MSFLDVVPSDALGPDESLNHRCWDCSMGAFHRCAAVVAAAAADDNNDVVVGYANNDLTVAVPSRRLRPWTITIIRSDRRGVDGTQHATPTVLRLCVDCR